MKSNTQYNIKINGSCNHEKWDIWIKEMRETCPKGHS